MQRRGEGGRPAKGQRQRTEPKARKAPTAHGDRPPKQINRLKRERDEALEQLAATGEILRATLNSLGDVQPVLDAVAKHGARICGAQFVDIILIENNMLRVGATFGDLERPLGELPLNRSTVMGRSICDMQPVQVADLQNAGDDFASGEN
jgi:two-component system, NtrC family, sensor kinase